MQTWEISDIDGSNKRRVTLAQFRAEVDAAKAKAIKVSTMGAGWYPPDHPKHVPGLGFNTHAARATKGVGPKWDSTTKSGAHGMARWTNPAEDGRKAPAGTQWFNDGPRTPESLASSGSKSKGRKMASAMIAKIPLPLSRHIAAMYHPKATA